MMARFMCYLALVSTIFSAIKKKNIIRIRPPLAKLPGSTHESVNHKWFIHFDTWGATSLLDTIK